MTNRLTKKIATESRNTDSKAAQTFSFNPFLVEHKLILIGSQQNQRTSDFYFNAIALQ